MSARNIYALVIGGAVLLFASLSLPSYPALAGQTPEQSIAAIESKLATALVKIDKIVEDLLDDLAAANEPSGARSARDEALDDLASRLEQDRDDITGKYLQNLDHPDVQVAYEDAMEVLDAVEAQAAAAIQAAYTAWVEANDLAETTTALPSTTATVPSSTTTTSSTIVATTTVTTKTKPNPSNARPPGHGPPPKTTTTTTTLVAAAVMIPPKDPGVALIPEIPEVAASAGSVVYDSGAEAGTATVGFVQRVVESQLPAAVSNVAVGPLVVLGLIFDAIRAAGALMVVPWLILGVYMAVLLRGQRKPQRVVA